MDEIAAGPASDRHELFRETGSELGLRPALIEKDFWVCWLLKLIFTEPVFKQQMVFKGGTSLSKAFGLIELFSEDIDLVLDWRLLGYDRNMANEPNEAVLSRTKQDIYNKELNAKAAAYIETTLLPQLNGLLSPISGIIARIDEKDPNTITVFYPAAFRDSYISPVVRLEIGPISSSVPSCTRSVRAYAAQAFPGAFSKADFEVIAIHAERTFWEKATILHQEAHRPGAVPPRYSRHYYDLYQLSESPTRKNALDNFALLKSVVDFKMRFYFAAWAQLELAVPGSFRLSPSADQIPGLERDYRAMREMFFRKPPPFATVLSGLAALEREINATREGH